MTHQFIKIAHMLIDGDAVIQFLKGFLHTGDFARSITCS